MSEDTNPVNLPAVPQRGGVTIFGGPDRQYCSLDRKDRESVGIMLKCINSADKRVSGCINEQLEVNHLFAHVVELPDDETGEVSECTRVVMISPEGVTYEAVSRGIARSIGALIAWYGEPPWKPALKVIVRQRELTGGHRMFYLDLVTDDKKAKR